MPSTAMVTHNAHHGSATVNAAVAVSNCPSAFCTVTSYVASAIDGMSQVIDVESLTMMLSARSSPMNTSASLPNPSPVIVTDEAAHPVSGVIAMIDGAGSFGSSGSHTPGDVSSGGSNVPAICA